MQVYGLWQGSSVRKVRQRLPNNYECHRHWHDPLGYPPSDKIEVSIRLGLVDLNVHNIEVRHDGMRTYRTDRKFKIVVHS